jgi:hypothetical protein
MKNSINIFKTRSPRIYTVFLGICLVLSCQLLYAQPAYLGGVKTANFFDRNALIGDAEISSPPMTAYNFAGLRYYYGDASILTGSTTVPVTLKTAYLTAVGLPAAGASTYIQFRNTDNKDIAKGTTTYFRLGSKPVNSGLNLNLGALVGLTSLYNITGNMYKRAGDYEFDGSGSDYSGDENVGQPIANADQTVTRLVIDKNNEWHAAVTPPATDDYNAVRLSVRLPGGLNLVTLSSVTANVYSAYTLSPGADCSTRPKFTDYGNTGISLSAGALLNGLDLSQLVENAHRAIDDDTTTYSSFNSGIASVGVASTVSQGFFFDRKALVSEGVKIKLSVSQAAITAGLLAGNISFHAFNGQTEVGSGVNLSNSLSLLGLDLLDIVTVGAGAEAYKNITVRFYPTGTFDRIEVRLDGLVSLSILGDVLQIHDVGLVPDAPVVSSSREYIFEGTQPVTTASTEVAGNNITWLGPLPETTVIGTAASASPYRFPVTLTENGNYAAVATKGTCTEYSFRAQLQVIVLKDVSAVPSAVSTKPYPATGQIAVTSAGRTFTYASADLPSFVTMSASGVLSANGNAPTVATPTTYTFNVTISEGGLPTGLTLTKQIVVNPLLTLPGGVFPSVSQSVETYSENISAAMNGGQSAGATGGKGSAAYKYSLTNPAARVAAVPGSFTLLPNGDLTGTPASATVGVHTFTIYVTDDEQVASAEYSLTVSGPLPVTLLDFSAKKEGTTAQISWTTTLETNSKRFDLERSRDGKAWRKIGEQQAKGESSDVIYYSLSDSSPLNGENLYRLKMIDLDGTYALSTIQSLHFEVEDINVYPNPVVASENINLGISDWAQIRSVKIVNAVGKTVFESADSLTSGIKTSYWGSGFYVIQVTRKDGQVSTRKFVKL